MRCAAGVIMKKSISISAALLSSDLRRRFLELLQVAGRRSIVAWELTDPANADVVLRERVTPGGDAGVSIYVSDTPLSGGNLSLLRLESSFHVNALRDMLDLAAVRVMDQREKRVQVAADNRAHSTAQYRLKHWVFLGPGRSGSAYTRVMAAMSRQSVSRDWMTAQGGLTGAQADSLLADLQLRGALLGGSAAPAPSATAQAQPVPAPMAPALRGFVSRLKSWIGNSSSRLLAGASR